ncbi:hypothetical protein EDM53_02005 [Rickettsiales endosymbiont of Peranema trichophorum]|uniref:FAD-dependent monooxygenase n=1 Tax=Rickettsiales endosymbiont of Peranema trichophorum TaxID=2486577 RepID=UPI0010D6E18F|nr:FAD-dependent monooxygenase [Rickettsiales endosymbiont of Peranema trichophorum]RZI47428.1 hypothetical protein EDM53_02005 [Rickettsiales endosymbiont of Peranema trichophorum]
MAAQGSNSYDVAIVGASYVGLTVAMRLTALNLRVLLLDELCIKQRVRDISLSKVGRDQQINEPSRLFAIAQGSLNMYERCGLKFDNEAAPIKHIRVSQESPEVVLELDPSDVGHKQFGVMLEERILLEKLASKVLSDDKICIMSAVTMKRIEVTPHAVNLSLEDSAQQELLLTVKLIIAADGKRSWIRQHYQIPTYSFDYGQYAVICDILHEKSHRFTACEKFLKHGAFAILPKHIQRESSIVWVVDEEKYDQVYGLPNFQLFELIKQLFGPQLGTLSLLSNIKVFPLQLVHAKRYIAHRCALVGDAAHSIHPITGQGLNLGLRDVDALVNLIAEQLRLGLDVGSSIMLQRYESLRASDNQLMIECTHNVNMLFASTLPVLIALRTLGLKHLNDMQQMKQWILKYAMSC